jgi:hypothetical protein
VFALVLVAATVGAGIRWFNTRARFDKKDLIYLVITVDVEALPDRAPTDHVKRLIYGDFGDARRAGIEEMMDAADKVGVKMTFFFDVLEETLYPGQIEGVAKRIVTRGHDLQLHTHPDKPPPSFWTDLGITAKMSPLFNRADADALFAYTHRLFDRWGLARPIAFRAGGYEYSRGFIEAMPAAKISYSYNYNPRAASQRKHLGRQAMFAWQNGVTEIPLSYTPHFFKETRFDDNLLSDVPNMIQEIERFGRSYEADNVLVMMMHSWSFLDLQGDHRVYAGDQKRMQFERFLRELPAAVRVVTATQLATLFEQGTLQRPPVLDAAVGLLNTAD